MRRPLISSEKGSFPKENRTACKRQRERDASLFFELSLGVCTINFVYQNPSQPADPFGVIFKIEGNIRAERSNTKRQGNLLQLPAFLPAADKHILEQFRELNEEGEFVSMLNNGPK